MSSKFTMSCAVAALALVVSCAPGGVGVPDAGARDAGAIAEGFGADMVEAPAVMDMAPMPESAPASPAPGTVAGVARSGVITAGDIDDTLNMAAFQSYLRDARAETRLPLADLGRPVLARLTGPDGAPAPGLRVTLRRPGAETPFYDGYSGVDGAVTVFPALFGARGLREVELRVIPDSQAEIVTRRLQTGLTRHGVALPFAGGWSPDFLDLVVVLDTTGSMGDELAWLTRELQGVVTAAGRAAPGADIRLGLVVYRDEGDDYVVRNYGFTGSPGAMRSLLAQQEASGGGDYPEAAAQALASAVALDWRRGRGERLLIHVADAPPHDGDAGAYLAAARAAAQAGIQIFGLGASGVASESEYLMRQAAAQTDGRYMFLTDDSGVGLSHAEPTISCYLVTPLRDLMVRVLRSELTGQRVEPAAGDVLRRVGSYQNGVCRN